MCTRARPNVLKVIDMQAPPGWVCIDAPKDHLERTIATPVIYEGPSNDTLHAFSRRPIFLGKRTIAEMAKLPVKAPDVDGVYDEYTVREVSGPPTKISVPGETHNSAVHRHIKRAKEAHDRRSVVEWRTEVESQRAPSPVPSSSWGVPAPSSSSTASTSIARESSLAGDDDMPSAADVDMGPAGSPEKWDGKPLRRKRKSTALRNAAKRAREENPDPPPKQEQRDKWVDPESDLIPPAHPIWAAALKMVDQSPARLEPMRPQNRMYRWPEPAIFVTTSNKGRFLVNWLAARQAWLARLTTSASQSDAAATNQMWRDYLGTKHDTGLREGTFAAKCRAQAEETFGMSMREEGPSIVYWQEAELLASRVEGFEGEEERHLMREVVWDACEHSFHFELRALDRVAAAEAWEDDPVGRDKMVAEIFNGRYVVDVIPPYNVGVIADDIADRIKSLEALRKVMKSWSRAPREVTAFCLGETLAEDIAKGQSETFLYRVQVSMAQFYCQTFYNWFVRPPIIPHLVPCRRESSAGSQRSE
ncbi:hypothetical protein PLICRDRAFT_181188 [Plicaturopsis crispa FD-325 SS-3]|uniref:Unplaced genomic scaffold PLICRscaffold_235, whole genome shotgun sequence n=1 Tax=Plicaturopsis crispa FD-325 SS-3 TaxID=944288 RepID=A0A0C9SJV9_PLICR|nr:hypothetical protein PLICRDRAFT_181188 [Plicaturopsis crispa FD-325 SS-3]